MTDIRSTNPGHQEVWHFYLTWEPVSGFEPLTCRLQEVCSQAAHALAAPMAQSIALMAPTALGLFGASSHESFHADGGQ